MDSFEAGIKVVGFFLLSVLVLVALRLVSREEGRDASSSDRDPIR